MIRKSVIIRLTVYSYRKLEQMKEAGFIKNYSRFCEKAVEDALDKKFSEFLQEEEKITAEC
jgi:hypothetical protein